jgi:hypothetical protein
MAIKIKAEYVSPEDLKTYCGLNLYEELGGNTTPDFFMRDREDEILRYINIQSWRPINIWLKLNKYNSEQMDNLKMAILEQAKYVFENGDVLANNGIDPEQGVKFGTHERMEASISPKAIDILKMSGIVTLVMRSFY